jgi:hypothetical protein
MKLITIFGSAIAALGLAACGAAVAQTTSPTLALTVAGTPTATPLPTPSPSESPSPSASASSSPTEGPCGSDPCQTGASWDTTCAVSGTAQGGSLLITWTAGAGQDAPVVPDTVTVDGHTLNVTGNPFTSGPYSVGNHSFTYPGGEGPSADGSFPFTIGACAVPSNITVSATCSATTGPTANVTFSGVTVGDDLDVLDSTYPATITSNPFTVDEVGVSYNDPYVESNGGTTVASGTFSVAACAG